MERRARRVVKPSAGRARSRRRSRSSVSAVSDAKTRRRAGRLTACAVIFLMAVFMRLLMPGAFAAVGDAITTAVDYRAALSILGEGISGERAFIDAVGEAVTRAFRGAPSEPDAEADADDTGEAVPAFCESDETHGPDSDTESIKIPDFANAVITTFMDGRESFSYHNIPAGTTFEMPPLGIAHTSPVMGEVVSPFGPSHGGTFNHGVDIAADEGTPLAAFADGEVIAVGESATLGKFVIISHDGAETRYSRISEVTVSAGQAVNMGDTIAKAGSTGDSTVPGLRFELRVGGVAVDPEHYIEWARRYPL